MGTVLAETANVLIFRVLIEEAIDDVILRAYKFKKKKNKIYIYDNEEVTKDE